MLTRTFSGKLWHYDMTSLDDWTSETAGAGTVTQVGDTVVCETAADADKAFIVKDLYLTSPCVVRARNKWLAPVATNRRIAALNCYPSAVKPTGAFTDWKFPEIIYYKSTTPDIRVYSYWWTATTGPLYITDDTYYGHEIDFNADDSCYFSTYSDNFSALLQTQTRVGYAAQYAANKKWLWMGDWETTAATRGKLTVDYVQCFATLDITVTDLPTGSAIRIYDASGTLLQSAEESGGVAVLDMRGTPFDTNTCPDTSWGGFRGSIKVFADNTYSKVITNFVDPSIWGGDEYAYSPTISFPRHIPTKQLYIDLLNRTGTEGITRLSESLPRAAPSDNIFEDLYLETCNPGGCTIGSFVLHRDITVPWADLKYKNRVQVGAEDGPFWGGFIDPPVRSVNPDTITVNLQGWSKRLNELDTVADIQVGASGYRLSTFLTGVVLADADTELMEGSINTEDHLYTAGTMFNFAPSTSQFDAIEALNGPNEYDWFVREDGRLDFIPRSGTIDWLIYVRDCSDLVILPNTDVFGTRVRIRYSPDGGGIFLDLTANDTDAQEEYGVVTRAFSLPGAVQTADAEAIRDLTIAEMAVLRVAAEFTCTRVYNVYGVEQPLWKVRAGENVKLVHYMETEGELDGVSDIASFQIKSTAYDHKVGSLAITPSEFIPSIERMMSRLEVTGY